MIGLLLSVIADAIFGSVARRCRSYEAEVDRYLGRRGFRPDQTPDTITAR